MLSILYSASLQGFASPKQLWRQQTTHTQIWNGRKRIGVEGMLKSATLRGYKLKVWATAVLTTRTNCEGVSKPVAGRNLGLYIYYIGFHSIMRVRPYIIYYEKF